MSQNITCPICGNVCCEGAKVCSKCGNSLPVAPVQPSCPSQPVKKKKTWLIVLIIVLAALLLLAIIAVAIIFLIPILVFFFISKEEASEPILKEDVALQSYVEYTDESVFKIESEYGDVIVDGSDIESVRYGYDVDNSVYCVYINLDSYGTQKFADFTRNSIGATTDIIIDGERVMSPTIVDEIVDGKLVISSDFTMQDAKDIADKINDAIF